MKPIMDQEVTIYMPTGKKDKNGRPETLPIVSPARVQFTSKTIQNVSGTVYQTFLEIDLPVESRVAYGTSISYTEDGIESKGTVVAVEGIKNLSGSRTDYWTVNIA
jgi:hypothetical protein